LLAAEITARMGRDPGEIYRELTREFGEPVYDRVEAPATPEQKELLAKLSPQQVKITDLAGEKIQTILTHAPGNGAPIGGLKVIAKADGSRRVRQGPKTSTRFMRRASGERIICAASWRKRRTAEGQRINAFMVEKIIGSKVINLKGETLGKIENLVVDIDTGRIVYAVLESGGFLGIGDKLFPVPWKSLAALPSEGIFFLNQSKEQMEKAPAFDKKNLPNMTDMRWGANVFKYYGAPPGYTRLGSPTDYDYGYYDYYASNPTYPGRGINPAPRTEDPYKKIFDSKTIKRIETMSSRELTADAELEMLQHESFSYFLHETNPDNGLVIDKTAADWPASIAATGFALAAYPVAVERGFMRVPRR
jgi:sporulation protein YlmC with PRC-barrel domain